MSLRIGMTQVLGVAALALVVGGCARHSDGKDPSNAADVEKAIKADEQKTNADFKAKSLEGLASHYADDAYLVTAGAAASGTTEIRKVFADALSDNYFALTFASDKIDVGDSGDLAYARGQFTEKHQDPKTRQIVTDSGSYLTVYKKQPDGSWKVVEDFATADPAKRKTESAIAKPAKMISF